MRQLIASDGKKQRVRSACVQLAFPFLHRNQGSRSLYFPRSLKNLNYAILSRPGFCLPVESLGKNFLSTPPWARTFPDTWSRDGGNGTEIIRLVLLPLPVLSIPKLVLSECPVSVSQFWFLNEKGPSATTSCKFQEKKSALGAGEGEVATFQ